MSITNAGNVGIGSTSFDPANPEKLLVDAGATGTNTLINATGNKDGYLQLNVQNTNNGSFASSDIVATANNGTDNSAYINMGINSNGYASGNTNILNGSNTAYLYANGSSFYIGNGAANKPLIFFTNSGSPSDSTANGIERMRIAANGNVGIGTTATGTYKLNVNGNVNASAGYYQSSDRRLKTNISSLKYGLKDLLFLQPVSYNWKDSTLKEKQFGLIAQDVRKVIPEIVAGDENTEKLRMNYMGLIPVLINAIKEQQKQIDDLKAMVKNLQR